MERYGKYFLNFDEIYTEADDEETTDDTTVEDETNTEDNPEETQEEPTETEDVPEETPAEDEKPHYNRNTRVIEIKPNNRSKIKFEDLLTPDDEEITDDTTGDEETETDETSPDSPVDDNEPDTTDVSFGDETDDGIEFNDDSTTDNGEGDTEGPAPDEPDTTDEDFGAESEEDTNTDNNAGEQPAEGEKKGPGLEYDSTRKYNLYKNFVSLNNAITNYISKLENNLGEDVITNQVYKKSTEKLREILELCNDYMIMKFEISSYVQSLLFFQNLVIMVQMVFDLIAKHTEKKKK